MKSALTYQAIGRSITFYMTTLLKDGLYIMVQLAQLIACGRLADVPGYLMDFNKLYFLLDAFNQWYRCLDPSEVEQ